MTKPVSADDRAILQTYVNESFERFKSIVKEGRPAFRDDDAALDKLATGEIFTAPQAQKSGLVDEIGFVEAAIDRAIDMASLSADEVRVVTYERPVRLFDPIGLARSEPVAPSVTTMLLDLATPRAYYLCTAWPGLTVAN